MEQLNSTALRNIGIIPALRRNYSSCKKIEDKAFSTEDYVGKITAVFSPYISKNISESRFIYLQAEIKKIVTDIKGKE